MALRVIYGFSVQYNKNYIKKCQKCAPGRACTEIARLQDSLAEQAPLLKSLFGEKKKKFISSLKITAWFQVGKNRVFWVISNSW